MNKRYHDFIPQDQVPTFDQLVSLIEKNFKDYLTYTKGFTEQEIEDGWQRYKALNHLYQDESSDIERQIRRTSEYQLASEISQPTKLTPAQITERKEAIDWYRNPTGHGAAGPFATAFIPCEDDDPRCCGGYTSNDGQSLCHVREVNVAAGSGKKEAALIMQWAFANIKAWDKSTDTVMLYDDTKCSSAQLYDIFKQQNK